MCHLLDGWAPENWSIEVPGRRSDGKAVGTANRRAAYAPRRSSSTLPAGTAFVEATAFTHRCRYDQSAAAMSALPGSGCS